MSAEEEGRVVSDDRAGGPADPSRCASQPVGAHPSRVEVIGNATLYLGDCRDILPTIGAVDSLVTDPPYEFETSGGGIFRREGRDCMDKIAEAGLDKGFDHALITAEQFRSAIVFCHNDQVSRLVPYLAGQYRRFALCFWHKTNPMPVANKHYKPDTEIYIHAWGQDGHPVGALHDKGRYVLAPVGHQDEWDHPTVKPLPLMQKIMRNVNGETICDPFMGTGTTGVAALEYGKSFIGVERDERYFDIACKRIEDAQRQGSLFGEAA